MYCSLRMDKQAIFVVDRPFYYVIREKDIGAALFEGRLANPSVWKF